MFYSRVTIEDCLYPPAGLFAAFNIRFFAPDGIIGALGAFFHGFSSCGSFCGFSGRESAIKSGFNIASAPGAGAVITFAIFTLKIEHFSLQLIHRQLKLVNAAE